jgi:sulfur carrier protein
MGTRRAIIAVMQVMLNGSPRHFEPPPATVAELVRALHLEGKRIAVELNGEIVPKSRHAETLVAAGDRIEVVAAVGGG